MEWKLIVEWKTFFSFFNFRSEESERIALIHHYSHAFNGFTAMLTQSEASALAGISSLFQL